MGLKNVFTIVFVGVGLNGFSQQIANEHTNPESVQEKHNVSYNYGVLDAFVGGLFRGSLPIKDLKLKGDFGLGVP